MQCEKHNVETAVSCGRCETPVCPKCMVHSDVGVRCKTCAPNVRPRQRAGGRSVVGLMVIGVIGLVVIGSVGGLFRGSDDSPEFNFNGVPNFYYDVTVNQIEDPWEGGQPSEGNRFVAIDVTVSADANNDAEYWTGTYDFKLTDTENFAYGALTDGKTPRFPEDISLQPGERVRAWVTFEVAEDSELDSLTSYEEVISLLDAPHAN